MSPTSTATPEPALIVGLNIYSIEDLPDFSVGPRHEGPAGLARIAAAGFAALQSFTAEPALGAGLRAYGFGRVDRIEDAADIATRHQQEGFAATTLHVGTGLESDDAAVRLAEAIVAAADRTRYPLFVETHRATITQDIKRTLDLVARLPEIRFNVDFSHYYTGSEMTYGDLDGKLDLLEPVFARTRFIHGRVSDPGCAQISVLDDRCAPHRRVFQRVWERIFTHFAATAQSGEVLPFCPEILGAKHFYARTNLGPDGRAVELTDRWLEALETAEIARRVWADVVHAAKALRRDASGLWAQ